MRPYREAAGYVGGLNVAGKAAYDTAPENETEFQIIEENPVNLPPLRP